MSAVSTSRARPAYRALVFDLDGTLIDSAPAMQAVAGTFLAGLGRPPLSLAETRSFVGEGARVFCRRMLDARGVEADESALDTHYAAFLDLYANAPAHDNVPYRGVMEALARFATAGVPMALCTNKPEAPTHKVIGALGLAPHFAAVVTGDTLPQKKPDPAPLRHAIAQLGVQSDETLFVGDSETDCGTALAAKVDFALHEVGYVRDIDSIRCTMRFADWAAFATGLDGSLAAR